jgi:hypothetical protein
MKANKMNAMQKQVLVQNNLLANNFKLVRTTNYDEDVTVLFEGDATVVTDGSGIWGAGAGLQVNITGISIHANDDDDFSVRVTHTFDEATLTRRNGVDFGMLYTDKGIERGVSVLLGVDVMFTEQGMQEDFYMSME